MERGVLVFVELEDAQHSFELPPTGTVAALRTILTSVCASNLCLHECDSGQLLCDADVLSDFAERPSSPPLPPDPLRGFCEQVSPEELVQEFERCHGEFYPPLGRRTVRVRASKGTTTFVRAAGCVHSFHCDSQDTLGDLRDVCGRTFTLDPIQVTLKDASGSLLPLSRDGDALQDFKNASVLNAEAGEGSVRVYLVLSESCVSYVDLPAAASLSDFRCAVTARVDGLTSVRFRLWNRGAEVDAKEGETVGQRLLGGHPVFVELVSDQELLLLPKNASGGLTELCEAPSLDMSASLNLWLEDEAVRGDLKGLFPQSRLEQLLDRVAALTGKETPLSVNVDGRCLARQELRSTLQELHIENGAVIRVEPPLQLHIDFGDSDTMMLTIPCHCTTVLQLRKKIEQESRIPISFVRPVVKDCLLPDCLSISECSLRSGDHIMCRRACRLRFWWEDQVASFFASPEMDLTEVTAFLEEKTGIAKDLLVLTELPSGRVILPSKKTRTVREAGLKDNSEVSVSKRPQGSGGTWITKSNQSDTSGFPSFMTSAASDDEDIDDDDNFDSDDD